MEEHAGSSRHEEERSRVAHELEVFALVFGFGASVLKIELWRLEQSLDAQAESAYGQSESDDAERTYDGSHNITLSQET